MDVGVGVSEGAKSGVVHVTGHVIFSTLGSKRTDVVQSEKM